MAYQSNDLSVLTYANGFTLWHYTTADTSETVEDTGYFNVVYDMFRPGDMIIANARSAENAHQVLLLVVAEVGRDYVVVQNLTAKA